MDLYRAKLLTSVFAFGLVVVGLLGIVLYYVFPAWMPNWFGAIFAFFVIIEMLVVNFVYKVSQKENQKQLLNAYLLTKVLKFFVSIVFVGAYALTVREGIKSFALVFMIFYILYLFYETMIFTRIEKRLKKKEKE